MAFTTQRYLINNLVDADKITASSQAAGTIRQPKKTGTGTATMTPAGSYTGASNRTYTVQCDTAGSVDGAATFRWKSSETAAGSWEASGVSAVSTPVTLEDGITITFSSGTLVLNDKWQFPVFAEYGPGKLFLNDRDLFWKSADLADLVTNGDFESGFTSGLADGWSKTGAGQTFSDETSEVHGGSHAQKITCADDGQSMGINQSLSRTAGDEYYISFWVYSSSSRTLTTYWDGVYIEEAAVAATTWVHKEFYYVATGTGASAFYIYNGSAACTIADYLIIDDVQVYSLPYFDLDLGSAQTPTAIALLDHNLSSDAVLTLKGNSSESWGSPGYEEDGFTVTDDPIIEYDGDTYRYWRFVFQDIGNADGYISVGKLYLGTYVELVGSLRNIPWGSVKADALQVTSNRSEAGKANSYVYARFAAFATDYFPTRTSGDLATLESIWAATFTISTGQRTSILVHYFYDEETTLYLCRCLTERFNLEYRDYAHYAVSFDWEQEIMTRTI